MPRKAAAKLAAWNPGPLAEPLPRAVVDAQPLDLCVTRGGAGGPFVHLAGCARPVLNLCSTNFLSLLRHARVTAACEATLARWKGA